MALFGLTVPFPPLSQQATFGPNGNFKGENRTAVVVTIEKSQFVLATYEEKKKKNPFPRVF